jgi:hypothetical protein
LSVFRGNCPVDTGQGASYTPTVEKQCFFAFIRLADLAMKAVSWECRAGKRVLIREREDDNDRTGRF